jgi:hypothetical protein
MAYGDAFFSLINERQIGQFLDDGENPEFFLSISEVTSLANDRCVADAREGGLIIGKFHTEGGIHMLQEYGDKFKYVGEIEGYEFILNPSASKKNKGKLSEINEALKPDKNISPRPFYFPDNIKIIDLRHLSFEIVLISYEGQFIINRAASEKNLELLDLLNR